MLFLIIGNTPDRRPLLRLQDTRSEAVEQFASKVAIFQHGMSKL